MTFYIPLERKFNVDQLFIKDLGLKMYETEVMTSYNDVTVNVLEKLSPSKHDIIYAIRKKI